MLNAPAVTESVQTSSAADEIEWAQLELASEFGKHDGLWIWERWDSRSADRAPKFTDAPHPLSYGAKLPMRTVWAKGHPRIEPLTAAEKKSIAARTVGAVVEAKGVVKAASAHPDSYRPDLPLRGLKLNGGDPKHKWTLTPAEKATLAARPLRYTNLETR